MFGIMHELRTVTPGVLCVCLTIIAVLAFVMDMNHFVEIFNCDKAMERSNQ
jgi:hypothetical protein